VVARPAQVLALASAVAGGVFTAGAVEPWNGVAQLAAATFVLTAQTLGTARVLTLPLAASPIATPRTGYGSGRLSGCQ
jgi:hypothetical protein